ncbi:MAG: DUF2971 domain-containing protein, partial [Pseudomonadota bacterium]
MVDRVHHYCSASVFLSLVKNKELWLTSLAQSNDNQEGTWMLSYWLDLFNRHRGDPKKLLEGKGAKFVVENILRHNVALGTCFSEDRDLLSQWRGYAGDGTGFSVTFDKEGLAALAADFEGKTALSLSKISYGLKDLQKVNSVVKDLYEAFGSDAKRYEEGQDGIGSISLDFTPEKTKKQRAAARKLFTIKNAAFAEEKEWRLFVFDSIRDINNVEFRESR